MQLVKNITGIPVLGCATGLFCLFLLQQRVGFFIWLPKRHLRQQFIQQQAVVCGSFGGRHHGAVCWPRAILEMVPESLCLPAPFPRKGVYARLFPGGTVFIASVIGQPLRTLPHFIVDHRCVIAICHRRRLVYRASAKLQSTPPVYGTQLCADTGLCAGKDRWVVFAAVFVW